MERVGIGYLKDPPHSNPYQWIGHGNDWLNSISKERPGNTTYRKFEPCPDEEDNTETKNQEKLAIENCPNAFKRHFLKVFAKNKCPHFFYFNFRNPLFGVAFWILVHEPPSPLRICVISRLTYNTYSAMFHDNSDRKKSDMKRQFATIAAFRKRGEKILSIKKHSEMCIIAESSLPGD